MSISLEKFVIKRLIVHEIFKRDTSGSLPPALNNGLTRLDDRGIGELQKRVVEAIGHDSHSIEMDMIQINDGSVYSFVESFLRQDETDDRFIGMSHQIVNKLVRCQTSQIIPGGIVLIFEGETGVEGYRYVAIIKADKLSGFSINSVDQRAILEYMNNLLLTPQQKLFKVALIVRNDTEAVDRVLPENVTVGLFDSNNNKAVSAAAASYFYESFMGCAYKRNNDVLTRDFFNYTKEFITKTDMPGSKKIDTVSALYVYVKTRTENTLNVNEFAQTYIAEARVRDSYKSFMSSKKVPATNIIRDVSMIRSKLRRRKIRFTNEVDVYAPVDNFEKNITIIATSKNETTLRIAGEIKVEA